MNDNDELLDRIIARLRSESVPAMPAEFTPRRAVQSPRLIRYAAAAGVVAASILGYVVMHLQAPKSGEPPAPFVADDSLVERIESGVVVKPVDLTAPLAELEAGLASMDAQIDELRKQAALLDARRRANAMLAQHEFAADTNVPAL
jgi:hypothetical protein